jgi:hypothetical protein
LDRQRNRKVEDYLVQVRRLPSRRLEGCLDRRQLLHNRRLEAYSDLRNRSKLVDSLEIPIPPSQLKAADYSDQQWVPNLNSPVGSSQILVRNRHRIRILVADSLDQVIHSQRKVVDCSVV